MSDFIKQFARAVKCYAAINNDVVEEYRTAQRDVLRVVSVKKKVYKKFLCVCDRVLLLLCLGISVFFHLEHR